MSADFNPDLLPVRMLNEYAYYPRLFHFMHIEGRWADNVYTEEGREVHRRVDRLAHVLPDPEADGAPKKKGERDDGDEPPTISRSVSLGSEQLGLTAKLDLVSTAGDEAVPDVYAAIGGFKWLWVNAPTTTDPGWTVCASAETVGEGPFTYRWSNGATTRHACFPAGQPGEYMQIAVTVTDTVESFSRTAYATISASWSSWCSRRIAAAGRCGCYLPSAPGSARRGLPTPLTARVATGLARSTSRTTRSRSVGWSAPLAAWRSSCSSAR